MLEAHIDQLAEAVVERMKREHHVFWIDPEVHADQHEFIKILMEERAERIARRKRLEEKIAGSVILTALAFVVTLLGVGFLEWLRGVERGQSDGNK
jgi:hypothetical protein